MKGDGRFLAHPLDWLVLALPLAYIVSSFNAANTGLAANEVVKTLLYFLIYWSAANLVSGEAGAVRIFKVICLAGVFVSLAGLLGLKAKSNPGIAGFNFHRYAYILVTYIVFLVFTGSKSNGGFLVFFLALVVYFAGLPRGRRVPAAFHLALAGVPAVPCALLFIRSAAAGKYAGAWLWFLAGAAAAVLLQWLYNSLEKRGLMEFISKKRTMVLIAVGVVVTSLVLAVFLYAGSNSQAVAQALDQFRLRNAVERTYFYRDAFKMIAQRPILGWGGGGWQEAYQAFQGYYYSSRQVHGHYIQVAVETGVAGLLVILSIWVAFLHLTYRSIKQCSEHPGRKVLLWTVFTVAAAIGAHAAIDFDLSLSALSLVLWAMWGLMRGLNTSGAASQGRPARAVKRPAHVFSVATVFSLLAVFVTGCFLIASSSAADAGNKLRAGDLPGAVPLLEKASFYNPFNAEYNSGLSVLYSRQGKLEQAVRQGEEALAKSKYSAPKYSSLAGLYISLNRYDEAAAMAGKAVELEPFHIQLYDFLARAYYTMGHNLMVSGQNEKAAEMLARATQVEDMIDRQAAKLGPLERSLWNVAPMLAPSAHTRLYSGASLALMGEYSKAEAQLQAVSGDNRIKAESLMWLGLVYQRQGRQAMSDEAMARALALVPDIEKQFSHIFNLIKK